GTTAREVEEHLARHGLWVGTHALFRDAVIRSHDHDGLHRLGRLGSAVNGGDGAGDLLEAAGALPGLRLRVEPVLGLLRRSSIDLADARADLIETRHRATRPCTGISRTIVPSTPR